jgi:chromosome segregation ATPase
VDIEEKVAELSAELAVVRARTDQHETDIARVNEAGSKRYSEITVSVARFQEACQKEHAGITQALAAERAESRKAAADARTEAQADARRDIDTLSLDLGRQLGVLSKTVESIDATLTAMRSKAIWTLVSLIGSVVIAIVVGALVTRGG